MAQDQSFEPKVMVHNSITSIDAAQWDALIPQDQPFLEHAFLLLLETSQSIGIEAGWVPYFIAIYDRDKLVAATLSYIKDNSRGEFIFDWNWADAAHSAGLQYYPKIVVGVPFTPAAGPRLLVESSHAEACHLKNLLCQALIELVDEFSCSSAHILFCQENEAEVAKKEDYLYRITHQYHWFNRGFASFNDFLSSFRSRARKQVKRERRKVSEHGLQIERKRGCDVTPEEWEAFDRLYRSTYARKWSHPYLTSEFFRGITDHLGDTALLVTARDSNGICAASLSFYRGSAVYGRYWGTNANYDSLHFELCYYQLIEFAIEHQLDRVEAGAQGEHKIKRGFIPCPTYSAHYLAHEGLRGAVSRYIHHESIQTMRLMDVISTHTPYRDLEFQRPPEFNL